MSTLLSASIAFAAVLISFSGIWIAYTKLRFDLFDKRYKIVESSAKLISKGIYESISIEDASEHSALSSQGQYLFPLIVRGHLSRVSVELLQACRIGRRMEKIGELVEADATKLLEERKRNIERLKTLQEEALRVYDDVLSVTYSRSGYVVPYWILVLLEFRQYERELKSGKTPAIDKIDEDLPKRQ